MSDINAKVVIDPKWDRRLVILYETGCFSTPLCTLDASDYYALMRQLRPSGGKGVREVRKDWGYTQEELAKEVGIARTYLSQIENGKAELTLRVAFEIAAVLSCTVDELFADYYQERSQTE